MYKDKEKRKEYLKQYYKKYYLENKAKQKKISKEYRLTDNGIKTMTIGNWKSRGVIDEDGDNYEKMYKIYLSVKYCERCNCQLNQEDYNSKKCLDHDHTTGYFRNIVCNFCNLHGIK